MLDCLSALSRLEGAHERFAEQGETEVASRIVDGLDAILSHDLRDETTGLYGADGILENPDPLIRERGMRILDKMLDTDAEVKNGYNLKKFMRLSRGWSVDACEACSPEAERQADFIRWNLTSGFLRTSIDSFLLKIWDAMRQGFKLAEMVWEVIPEGPWAGMIGLSDLVVRNSRNYSFKTDEQGRLDPMGIVEGISSSGLRIEADVRMLPTRKFVVYTYGALDNDGASLYGRSDFRVLWRYFYGNLVAHAEHLRAEQTFARPPLLARVPDERFTKKSQDKIQKDLAKLYGRVATLVPKEVDVEVMESKRSRQDAAAIFDYHGNQISKGQLLGPLLAGTQQRGVSLGKKQWETFIFVLDYMGLETSDLMERQIFAPVIAFNFLERHPPRFKMPRLSRDPGTQADFMKTLVTIGVVDPREPWVRETLDVPQQRSEERDRLEGGVKEDVADAGLPEGDEQPPPLELSEGGLLIELDGELSPLPGGTTVEEAAEGGFAIFFEEDNGMTTGTRPVASLEEARERIRRGTRIGLKGYLARRVGRRGRQAVYRIVEMHAAERQEVQVFAERGFEVWGRDRLRPLIGGYLAPFRAAVRERSPAEVARALRAGKLGLDPTPWREEMESEAALAFARGARDLVREALPRLSKTPTPGNAGPIEAKVPEMRRGQEGLRDLGDLPLSERAWRAGLATVTRLAHEAARVEGVTLREAMMAALVDLQDEATRMEAGQELAQWEGEAPRVDLVLRNLLGATYNAGRRAAAEALPEVVALRYSARIDGTSTPFCLAWDGVVLSKADRLWDAVLPPNHFGCRAMVRPVLRGDRARITRRPPELRPEPGFGTA